ncbi:MAG: replication restart helicase PriA, partial [Puniceicoccales bacterium]
INRLTKRVDDRQLPTVHIVDMRREKMGKDGLANISRPLAERLIDRYEKREQSILFLNRRGYSNSVLCPDCGYVPECPHCDVTLTYHKSDERIKCHICGYFERAPSRCAKCGSVEIKRRGFGTQKIEEAIQRVVPRAKVVRLDTDTMTKKNLFRHILNDFRAGKIDILVGTQMIAKGLDFPNVTLVGLVDADIALHVPDFRASERCFQLLVQVAGRAGRGDTAGEVIVQTFMPENEPIQFARRGDFDGYLEVELEQRREFHYPPFRHIVRHLFRGRNPDKVIFYAEKWADLVEEKLEHPVEIRGPAPAPLEKMKDTYRFHIWYFLGNVSKVLPSILALRKDFPMDDEVIDVFDVDPVDMV